MLAASFLLFYGNRYGGTELGIGANKFFEADEYILHYSHGTRTPKGIIEEISVLLRPRKYTEEQFETGFPLANGDFTAYNTMSDRDMTRMIFKNSESKYYIGEFRGISRKSTYEFEGEVHSEYIQLYDGGYIFGEIYKTGDYRDIKMGYTSYWNEQTDRKPVEIKWAEDKIPALYDILRSMNSVGDQVTLLNSGYHEEDRLEQLALTVKLKSGYETMYVFTKTENYYAMNIDSNEFLISDDDYTAIKELITK